MGLIEQFHFTYFILQELGNVVDGGEDDDRRDVSGHPGPGALGDGAVPVGVRSTHCAVPGHSTINTFSGFHGIVMEK